MKLRDYIVILIGMFLTSLLLQWLKPELVPGPSDPGKEQRDSTENRSNVDLSNSVRWKQWSDSVIQRAEAIKQGRDRERISTNTENYINEQGLDTASHVLTREH